jgi:phosphoribosylformylglycinamidine cyclo-ligase
MPVNGKAKPSLPLTYRDAGVDIDAGDALVDDIKKIVRSTRRPEVLAGVGGFDSGRVTGLGQDLVGMCVNDVLVSGAEPLFFLDYYATGKLEPAVAAQVIKGIAQGCKLAGCALVGGETAEMPGLYQPGDFDLAGFCVAVVEKSKIIDGSKIRPGDVMIALPSSGAHSNGYSLVRKILQRSGQDLDAPLDTSSTGRGTLGDALLAPTTIYVKPILKLLGLGLPLRGMAHITGGGISGNLTRCFPKGCAAAVDVSSWKRPAIFDWLQQQGAVEQDEMWRVFNNGVGFVVVVPRLRADETLAALKRQRIAAWMLGEVVKGKNDAVHYA